MLTVALNGQDVLICALGMGTDASVQNNLIDAAVAANVKRFIPNEFALDTLNPLVRQLPVFKNKLDVMHYLERSALRSGMTYTYIINSVFLDWGLQSNFILDISQYKPTIYGSGDELFSTTTMATAAKAVVEVLKHYDQTRNRAVYIQDAVISQNKLLAIAKKHMPSKLWEPTWVDLGKVKAEADSNIVEETYDMSVLYSYLFVALFQKGYGGRLKRTDNDLFGIVEMTGREIEDAVRANLPRK